MLHASTAPRGPVARSRPIAAAVSTLTALSAVAAGALVPAVTAAAVPSSHPALVRPSRLAPARVPSGSVRIGLAPAGQRVHLSVVLRPSDPAAVTSLLAGLYDPSSPDYHHWLAPGQFARDYGPSADEVASTLAWLHGAGLSQTEVSGQSVTVDASAAAVSAAFGTPIDRYRDRTGRIGYRSRSTPLVPQSLAGGQVTAVLGLDTLTTPQPLGTVASSSASSASSAWSAGPSPASPSAQSHAATAPRADGLSACPDAQGAAGTRFYTLDNLGASYGIGSMLTHGERGQHQTVAVYELAPHSGSDVATYESCFGLSNPVGTSLVDGGGTPSSGGTAEADLDIEQVATQAPGASIVSYEGPDSGSGPFDTWNKIVSADTAQVISSSWGTCELASSLNLTGLFQQAAAQGQTVLAASGDSGSEDCFRVLSSSDSNQTTKQVDYPASDPYVTAVGGTSRFGPGLEDTWNFCQGTESISCANSFEGGIAAGGGGASRFEPRPGFEPNLVTWSTKQTCGFTCRQVPDVSANAGVGMVVYVAGAWNVFVGTSLASPLWAGIAADRNSGCTETAGLWAPTLYSLAATGSYGSAFTDVTVGDNDMTGTNGGDFAARSGYDAATGIGSPLAAGLSCAEVSSVGFGNTGSHVTLSGLGLEHATITFGGKSAQVLGADASSATVVVPPGSGTVTVAASGLQGTGTTTAQFTYGATAPPPPPPPPAHGYWLVGGDGGIFSFGSAQFYGSTGSLRLQRPVVGITPARDHGGYWLVASDGGVFAFGDSGFYGSIPGLGFAPAGSGGPGPELNAPIVGIVPSSDGGGYFMVASDGGVFAFGDARFAGSCPGIGGCAGSAVAVMPDSTGNGYWLVTATGAVYAFGDAPYDGAPGPRSAPVTSAVRTPDGKGYWILFADGAVTSFGDATNLGQPGAAGASTTAISSTADGHGYWVATSQGAVYSYGDAPYDGGMAGVALNAPIIAAVGW